LYWGRGDLGVCVVFLRFHIFRAFFSLKNLAEPQFPEVCPRYMVRVRGNPLSSVVVPPTLFKEFPPEMRAVSHTTMPESALTFEETIPPRYLLPSSWVARKSCFPNLLAQVLRWPAFCIFCLRASLSLAVAKSLFPSSSAAFPSSVLFFPHKV